MVVSDASEKSRDQKVFSFWPFDCIYPLFETMNTCTTYYLICLTFWAIVQFLYYRHSVDLPKTAKLQERAG